MRSAVAVAMLASGLIACSSPIVTTGTFVRITNDTNETIVLSYEEPGHTLELGTLGPGLAGTFTTVFDELGAGCHGPFVARSEAGVEVARLDRGCPSTDWRVAIPGSS